MRWSMFKGRQVHFWLDWWCGDGPIIDKLIIDPKTVNRDLKVVDLINGLGDWDLTQVQDCLPTDVLSKIRSIPLPQNVTWGIL